MNRKFEELDAEVASVAMLRGVEHECTPFSHGHTWTASMLGLPIRFAWRDGRWAVRAQCDRMPVTVYHFGLSDALMDLANAFAEAVGEMHS